MMKTLLDSLIVHLRGLNVSRYRTSKVPELPDIGGDGNVQALSMVVQGRIAGSERRRKTAIHRWIDELC